MTLECDRYPFEGKPKEVLHVVGSLAHFVPRSFQDGAKLDCFFEA